MSECLVSQAIYFPTRWLQGTIFVVCVCVCPSLLWRYPSFTPFNSSIDSLA